MTNDHDHQWGEIETARFTGNPHRKCQVEGCRAITLWEDEYIAVCPACGNPVDYCQEARVREGWFA